MTEAREAIAQEQYEEFIKNIKEARENDNEDIEVPFGSNRNVSILSDGSVIYNTHKLEEMKFESVEKFGKWFFLDDETIFYDYSILLGSRDEEGEIIFDSDDYKNIPIDEEEDGSDVWSKSVRINETQRDDSVFKMAEITPPNVLYNTF